MFGEVVLDGLHIVPGASLNRFHAFSVGAVELIDNLAKRRCFPCGEGRDSWYRRVRGQADEPLHFHTNPCPDERSFRKCRRHVGELRCVATIKRGKCINRKHAENGLLALLVYVKYITKKRKKDYRSVIMLILDRTETLSILVGIGTRRLFSPPTVSLLPL